MLNLKEDERCLKLEKYLDDYVLHTNLYRKKHRAYFANGGNKFYVNDYMANQLDKVHLACGNFSNGLTEYLCSFKNTEDQQQVAGHFLWRIINKSCANPDFKSEGVALCPTLFNVIADEQKIKFLEFLFTESENNQKNNRKSALWHDFDDMAILKLMNFAPNKNIPAVNRLYTKTLAHLDNMPRKSKFLDKKIKLLGEMFQTFVNNIEEITPEAAVKFSDIYFKMSEKTNEFLNPNPLIILCQKTPYARDIAEQSASPYAFDKQVIKDMFKKYIEHVCCAENKDFNENLSHQMIRVAQSAGYTISELKDLTAVVMSKIPQREGKKRSGLINLADILSNKAEVMKKQNNPLTVIDTEEPQDVYNDKVVLFASALFEKARQYPNMPVNTAALYEFLTHNETINKPLLLSVVDAYGESVQAHNIESGYVNDNLHRQMTKMLQNIVTKYDYSPEEMNTLKRHISKGAGGHDEFEYMAMVVENAQSINEDWRYRIRKSQKVPTITLNGKSR